MAEIRAAYDPIEQTAAAFAAAAGQVDALLPQVDGPAGTDSGNAAVNDGIARVADDLRNSLAGAATALWQTSRLLHGARAAYDTTDSSVMPSDPAAAGPA